MGQMKITRVIEYPIKGLPALKHAYPCSISSSGAIGSDRHVWFELEDGTVVNGKWALSKQLRRFFRIRASYVEPLSTVELSLASHEADDFSIKPEMFELSDGGKLLVPWMSKVLGQEVWACQNLEGGNPDDHDSPGLTLFSEASAKALAEKFKLTSDDIIERLRPNILIDGVQAFEEYSFIDRTFRIGSSRFLAVNACKRCPVPSTCPRSGETYVSFSRMLTKFMVPHLRQWAPEHARETAAGFVATLNTRAVSIARDATVEAGMEFSLV